MTISENKLYRLFTFLRGRDVEKKLKQYQRWIMVCGGLLIIIVGYLIFQQKLQNDQIELAQPDTTQTFEGNLAALPLFGQTFVPRQAGLRGIYLPISIESKTNGAGGLNLHLRSSPEATEDIRTATLSIADLEGQRLARFTFEPLPDSLNTRYYFFIEPSATNSNATINLYYGGPTTYINGALYLDGEPQESQASFFLAYDRRLILQDWGFWLVANSLNLLALFLLTTLPGGALLIWLWPKNFPLLQNLQMSHIEWLALASGLSVAVYPILLLWGNVIGLKFGPGIILALLILSGLSIIGKIYFQFRQNDSRSVLEAKNIRSNLVRLKNTLLSPPILLFWLIFLLSAGVRIFVVRGQEVPLWQDSYHHTMISQLLVDHGGLFESWLPYAPMESFSYHFGFHTFVALYHWLTGQDIVQSVLIVGQLMNILAVLVMFPLGRRFGGSDWCGVLAVLISGLISQYPMYYVNWGRYTQLTGQVILPTTIIFTLFLFNKRQGYYHLIALISISLAGLALSHYRVLFFYPCFIMPLLLLVWSQKNWQFGKLKAFSFYLGGIGCGSFILILPWLWRVVGSRLWRNTSAFFTATASNSDFVQAFTVSTPSLFDQVAPVLVILAIIGIMWGSWQRQAGIIIIAGWGLIVIILANPHFFGLPGTGIITYFAALIAAYLPISILAGFTLAQIIRPLLSFHWVTRLSVALVIISIALWGVVKQVTLFEPQHTMVTKSDLTAMDWIKQNTPPEATFWINARLGYGDTTVVGTDAGWWIPFLAQRKGMILPMIYASEITIPVDYPFYIQDLYRQVHQTEFNSEETWETLREAGVTHVYIGQRRGQVWQGAEEPLDPVALESSSHYHLVYKEDQVRIFQLVDTK